MAAKKQKKKKKNLKIGKVCNELNLIEILPPHFLLIIGISNRVLNAAFVQILVHSPHLEEVAVLPSCLNHEV